MFWLYSVLFSTHLVSFIERPMGFLQFNRLDSEPNSDLIILIGSIPIIVWGQPISIMLFYKRWWSIFLLPGRISTYLKARTHRRLKHEVVRAKSRQRCRKRGRKTRKWCYLKKAMHVINNVLYRCIFKQNVTLISLYGHKHTWVRNKF